MPGSPITIVPSHTNLIPRHPIYRIPIPTSKMETAPKQPQILIYHDLNNKNSIDENNRGVIGWESIRMNVFEIERSYCSWRFWSCQASPLSLPLRVLHLLRIQCPGQVSQCQIRQWRRIISIRMRPYSSTPTHLLTGMATHSYTHGTSGTAASRYPRIEPRLLISMKHPIDTPSLSASRIRRRATPFHTR